MNDDTAYFVGNILAYLAFLGPLVVAGYLIAARVGFAWGRAVRNSAIVGVVYVVAVFLIVAPRGTFPLLIPILLVIGATGLTLLSWLLFAAIQSVRERP